MDLIGLDVGFSAKGRTTGVARLANGKLLLGRAATNWKSRAEVLGATGEADVAALDAPIVPGSHKNMRLCERVFASGAYQRKCKPGFSHIRGTGQRLREAGSDAARQVAPIVSDYELATSIPRVCGKKNIVEAFPNAFLGVAVPLTSYEAMRPPGRGKKFDWLYDQWRQLNLFAGPAAELDPTGLLLRKCRSCTNQDERAALVCLLTAGAVALGLYTAVGDKDGGYFFLPRLTHWAPWAREELEKQRARPERDSLEIWVNGVLISSSQSLPEIV